MDDGSLWSIVQNDENKMKILYVITGLGLGGAEKVVCDLADQMVLKGHEVKIAYLTGDRLVIPKSPDVEVIYLALNGIKSFIPASSQYRNILRSFRPDVVHAHMVHANIFVRLNRINQKFPKLICTAHNSNEGGKIRMLAYRYTNLLSDINTNVSEDASQALIDKGAFTKDNLMTVYNGIDLNKFNINKAQNNFISVHQNIIKCISVGRFNEQKDYPNLLNAIALLEKKLEIPVKFQIAGDGVLRLELENLINKLNLNAYVELLGNRKDIPQLLNNSKFFILSSKHEGLPTVVIEAMACGCFVIATDCGGTAEIMGDTGILVPPQDSQALAQAMQQALSLTDEQIEVNNKRARKRIEELFSLEKSVEKWLEIYEAKQ